MEEIVQDLSIRGCVAFWKSWNSHSNKHKRYYTGSQSDNLKNFYAIWQFKKLS